MRAPPIATPRIGDEARAVGVVAHDARAVTREEVRRARFAGTIGGFGRELERLHLERKRHVRAASALREEALDRRAKALGRRDERRVLDALAQLSGEARVDRGRQAVRHGIADDDVAIHAGVVGEKAAGGPQ
jgi:hypothetical protein